MIVRYEVEVDFHPATPAVRRIARLFDDIADIAGVREVKRTVIEPEVEATEAERVVD